LRGTSPGAENPVPIGTTANPAFPDMSGLVKGTTYYYVVQPRDSSGKTLCTSNEAAVKAP
jgi:hypothetical protein